MQERPQTKRPADGFTILELLVVMGVMILLLGALVPAIWNVENEGRLSAGGGKFTAVVPIMCGCEAPGGRPPTMSSLRASGKLYTWSATA